MRFSTYIKGQIEWIISIAAAFILLNLILITSIPLDKSFWEVFYLDVLTLAVLGTGGFFHFLRMNREYKKIRQAITDEKDVDSMISPSSGVFGLSLMAKLLEYKNSSFSRKENDYQQKLNDLKDYITHTVHDLKVNLSVCEMATKRLENDEDIAHKLLYQIGQMKFRINQTLHITRANHYSEDILSEDVDIQQVIRDAISDNTDFFIHRGVSLQMDNLLPYHLVSDRKWVHYIITQILNNSSKYVKKDGEVVISSTEDIKAYRLHIRDNGIGIPKEEIRRVFDKGFTGSNGRSNTKSTGMGMYYAKKMADTLGIGIEIESERGVYTEFILSFYKLSDYMLLNVT